MAALVWEAGGRDLDQVVDGREREPETGVGGSGGLERVAGGKGWAPRTV